MKMLHFQSQFSQLKIGTPFSGRGFSFWKKNRFKVKLTKLFKILSDCHVKTWRSLKRRAIFKIPSKKVFLVTLR